MSVTQADREKAAGLLRGGYRQEAIAAALAEEREKARAPFLRLAADWPDTTWAAEICRVAAEDSQ